MKELIENVVQWGRDRGLDKVGHLAQAKYTLKETAELLDAYADGDVDKMNDAIGDIAVTLIVGASNSDEVLKGFKTILLNGDFGGWCDESNFMGHYLDLIDSCSDIIEDAENNKDMIGNYHMIVSSLHTMTIYVDGLLSLKDCLQLAYDEIKNRKGKLINGQFIKN